MKNLTSFHDICHLFWALCAATSSHAGACRVDKVGRRAGYSEDVLYIASVSEDLKVTAIPRSCSVPTCVSASGKRVEYNQRMERIVDKSIIILCCGAALFLVPFATTLVVGLLFSLVVGALAELQSVPRRMRETLLISYLIAALFVHEFVFFLPLIAYDCMSAWPLRLAWCFPYVAAFKVLPFPSFAFVGVLVVASCALSLRTARSRREREDHRRLRDETRELSLALEQKNRDLQEKQDLEVKLATLDERARIAREIHDNVGHLLTRSVLQIEALQVIHAKDVQVKEGLAQVGATVHEAFDTVRDSVHDLHDDSFDLHTRLFALAKESPTLDIKLDYQIQMLPQAIAYSLLAVIRESLANTVKHSDATTVKVSVIEYPGFWQLIVHDNGSKNPFESEASLLVQARSSNTASAGGSLSAKSTGIGLRSMEERARSIGGVFRLDYERGLRVFVSVPKEKLGSVTEKGANQV